MKSRRVFLPLLLLSLTGVYSTAFAQQEPVIGWMVSESQRAISLEEAVEMVRDRTGGRILKAQTVEKDGQVFYAISVLKDKGKVSVYRVDPQSGAMF